METTVNQRVSGSSPEGGAKPLVIKIISGSLFLIYLHFIRTQPIRKASIFVNIRKAYSAKLSIKDSSAVSLQFLPGRSYAAPAFLFHYGQMIPAPVFATVILFVLIQHLH